MLHGNSSNRLLGFIVLLLVESKRMRGAVHGNVVGYRY